MLREEAAMHRRLLFLGAMAVACGYGCAQRDAAGPMPAAGSSASAAARIAPQSGVRVKYFSTPSIDAWPWYIVVGPQRALWFTELFADAIGRITMDGHITDFPIGSEEPEGIVEGPDGNLWFTAPGAQAIGRLTPQGAVTNFPIPGSPNASPRGITVGSDGNLWYVEFYDGYIGRVTPQGQITRFAIPDAQSGPWDIKTGSNGYLYFSESQADRIGIFDPATLQFKSSLPVPTPNATPWGLLVAPNGQIWFTERNGNKIATILPSQIKEFSIAQQGSYPEALAATADGNLWFTEGLTGDLGRIRPATDKFGAIVGLPSGSIPNGIVTAPNGNVWFTISAYHNPSEIGEVVLR